MATPFAQALGRILLRSRPGPFSVLPKPPTSMFGLPSAAATGRVPSWMGRMPGIPAEAQAARSVVPALEPGVVPRPVVGDPRAATISRAVRAQLGIRKSPRPMPTGGRKDMLQYFRGKYSSPSPSFGRPDIARTGALRAAGQQASVSRGQLTPDMSDALEQFIQREAGGLSPFLRARYAIRLSVKENDPNLLRNGQELAKRFENVLDDAQVGIINDEIAAARKALNIADDADLTIGYQPKPEPEDVASLARGESQFKWTRSTHLATMRGIENATNLKELGDIYGWAMSSDIIEQSVERTQLIIALQQRAEAVVKENLRRRFMRDVSSLAEAKGVRSVSDLSTSDFTKEINDMVDLFYSSKILAQGTRSVSLLPQTVKGVYNQQNFLNSIRTSYDNKSLADVLARLKKIAPMVPDEDKALINATFQRQNKLIRKGYFEQANKYLERELDIDMRALDNTVKRYIQLKDGKVKPDYSPLRTRSKGVRPAYGDTAAYVEGQLSAPTSTWRGKEGDLTVEQAIGNNRAGMWEDFMRGKSSYVNRSGRVEDYDPYALTESAAPVREVIAAARKAGNNELVAELMQRNSDELVRVPPELLSRMSTEQRSILVQRRVPIGFREAGLGRPYVAGESGAEAMLPASKWLDDIVGRERAKKLKSSIDPEGEWFNRPIRSPDPKLGITRQEWIDNYGYANIARIKGATTLRDADRALALVQAAKAYGLVDEGFWRLVAMEYGVKVKSLLSPATRAAQVSRRFKNKGGRFIEKRSGVYVRMPRLRESFTDMQEMLDYIGPMFSSRISG